MGSYVTFPVAASGNARRGRSDVRRLLVDAHGSEGWASGVHLWHPTGTRVGPGGLKGRGGY